MLSNAMLEIKLTFPCLSKNVLTDKSIQIKYSNLKDIYYERRNN